MDVNELVSSLRGEIWGVWFLAGAALVFWMQAGFAMVEAGFTRAKNTGNIIMKNLMDFCIGTVMWFLIGASFMLSYTDPVTGEVSKGVWSFLGKPGFSVFSKYASFDFSGFVFNLVFCATTATIVSGAMAERTKFSTYCIFSAIISGIVYPIEAHWTWGGGFLAQWGFHDYAGSACIHLVGGICALIGAAMLGPRLGKFSKDKNGKITKVHAFPGHNLTIGALGVFILWLGWYGFNGAAATDLATLGSVFLTTTVAPAVATVVAMIFTWAKYKKPDVSMCLNASLAGLVAITAPCDVADCAGAAIIGAVSGLLVVWGVWFLDYKLHIDDPVGASAVHLCNGLWGTIAVGFFATKDAPGFATAGISEGLFYGGGFSQLAKQLGGMAVIILWTVVTISIVFYVLKKTIGLRVTAEEEILGLDKLEHGIDSSYAGFSLSYSEEEKEEAAEAGIALPVDAAVPVVHSQSAISEVVIITRREKFDALKNALNKVGITGITVSNVMGCGAQKGASEFYRGSPVEIHLLPKIKVEIFVANVPVQKIIEVARKILYTGHIGDGKIFVLGVESAVKVRTGESGRLALADESQK